MPNKTILTARPEVLMLWSSRTKCVQCKHRFDKPFILPVAQPVAGKFQPNFNTDVLFHMQDTHGIPADVFAEWLTGSIYGQELGDFGIKSNQPLSGIHRRDEKL